MGVLQQDQIVGTSKVAVTKKLHILQVNKVSVFPCMGNARVWAH